MKENEVQITSAESRKEKIRARYKGLEPDELDVIPAIPQANFYEDESNKRVAVYARVSTDDPRQTSSYELQKNHYIDVVNSHPGWKLVDIYADEGISGTSLQHRDAFKRMIDDCKAGKIDLIITKSVSRFARNVLDCIGYVRQMAAMRPPIGILFETENLYTLNSSSEMTLAFISTLAQEESHNKSEIMNASIEMRFRRGIFLTPPLLGYDLDSEGNLIINEDEAKTIRLIFFMYLYGYTCRQIAETLTNLGCPTKKNNTSWNPSTVLQVLQNERHCGDVLARKTWTPNYLDHKSKKNQQDRNQYRKRNHHEAIISRDDFIAVQRLISNARYGNKGFLPELQVIPDGALKGFVSINPRWAGFKDKDYQMASASVYDESITSPSNAFEVKAQSGDFDLRGFEIARSQFFDTAHKICVTFSFEGIIFSTECVRRFDKVLYVELLVHPSECLLAVRPCSKETRNAVQWAKLREGKYYPRTIYCTAYINMLFVMFGWRSNCRYRVRGVCRQKKNESVAIFDMRETEMFIPSDVLDSDVEHNSAGELFLEDLQPLPIGPNNSLVAYPSSWADNFGNNYYRHAQARELAVFEREGQWEIGRNGQPYKDSLDLQTTDAEEIGSSIQQIISDIKQGAICDGN